VAERTIREFSAPSNTNAPTGPTTTLGDGNFELKPALIHMVQANLLSGKPNKDANALQHFLEVCRTFTILMPSSSPTPVLIAREGKVMVLCEAICHKRMG
jgi:hypothetical protein